MLALLVLASAACSQAEQEVEPPPPEDLRFVQLSANQVEHGERIANVLGCTGCHDKNLQGHDWSDELGVLWTGNLTRSAEKHSDAELVTMITKGRRPGRDLHGMPSHIFTHLAPTDLAAIIAFVRSKPVGGIVHPNPTIGPELRKMMSDGTYKSSAQEVAEQGETWPPDMGPEHAYARHIVRATCVECHKMDLRGDDPDKEKPPFSVDLRIVGSYEPADFLKLMHTGKAAGDRELEMMSGVARGRFSHLTDDEVEAIRSYLVEVARRDP